MFVKGIIHELLWFLRGDTNIRYLVENGVHIWDGDAYRHYNELCIRHGVLPLDMPTFVEAAREGAESPIDGYRFGDLDHVYGYQWRSWPAADGGAIDQIRNVIETIKRNPTSRRMIVSAWNVAEIDRMALPPCHVLFQFHVAEGRLSCQLYQRSADTFLGVPFNIASYALLTMMIARECDLYAGRLHTYARRYAYISQSSRTGRRAALTHAASAAAHASQRGDRVGIRFPLRGLLARRLRSVAGYKGRIVVLTPNIIW